jgi:glutathione S-transferase
VARAVSAEMHSGFAALRSAWSLRAADTGLDVPLDAAGRADLARIDALWSDCLARHRASGPWLFGGRYCIADAMYAPVVLRFNTYGASLSPPARAYFDHVMADPHLREWIEGARREVALEARPAAHP